MKNTVQFQLKRFEDLSAQRSTYEDTWDDICRIIRISNITILTEHSKGDNTNADESYDSTAPYAAQRLSAVINSSMTNQSTEWFQLETDNTELNKVKGVKEWLERTSNTVRKELENSNFYTELLSLYYDLTTIGTGVMYIEDDTSPDKELRFSTRHIREIYADEDKYGQIDTIYRLTKMTARQMVQRWEDSVHDKVKKAMEDKPDEEYEVLHCVFPREERNTNVKDSKNLKYASIWIDKTNAHLINESGFNNFPYVVPRWEKLPGEVYGRSPAYIALPDVKTLNAMQESLLTISQKIANPPMMVSGDLDEALDITPGAVNYGDAETGVNPLSLGYNVPVTIDMIQLKIDRILEIFFNNQLQIIDKREMTAREVATRTDENWRVLASIFSRLQAEMLEKLLARTFSIIQKSVRIDGTPIIENPPDSIGNAAIRIKYVSPLAKSQRAAEVTGIGNTIMQVMEMSKVRPEALDNINFDAAIRALSDLYGAPPEIIIDKDEMDQMRQVRAQQMQAMQQQQMEKQGLENFNLEAQAGKKIVDAKSTMQEMEE